MTLDSYYTEANIENIKNASTKASTMQSTTVLDTSFTNVANESSITSHLLTMLMYYLWWYALAQQLAIVIATSTISPEPWN